MGNIDNSVVILGQRASVDNIIFFCLWAEFFLDKLSAKILSWRLSHPPIKYVSPRFYVEIKSQWPFSSIFKKIKKYLIFFFLRPNLSAKIQLSPTFLRAPLACSAFYYPLSATVSREGGDQCQPQRDPDPHRECTLKFKWIVCDTFRADLPHGQMVGLSNYKKDPKYQFYFGT